MRFNRARLPRPESVADSPTGPGGRMKIADDLKLIGPRPSKQVYLSAYQGDRIEAISVRPPRDDSHLRFGGRIGFRGELISPSGPSLVHALPSLFGTGSTSVSSSTLIPRTHISPV
ncbi:hypothetical protein KM043_014231 [Ampulex compressa]|nr:hypothetical protein KM043_014231 [Ampulex compressa]